MVQQKLAYKYQLKIQMKIKENCGRPQNVLNDVDMKWRIKFFNRSDKTYANPGRRDHVSFFCIDIHLFNVNGNSNLSFSGLFENLMIAWKVINNLIITRIFYILRLCAKCCCSFKLSEESETEEKSVIILIEYWDEKNLTSVNFFVKVVQNKLNLKLKIIEVLKF